MLLALDIEMLMRAGLGVVPQPRAIERDLAHQPRLAELLERVVDSGERDIGVGPRRLLIQRLGRRMPVALAEQQPAERHALARRPQAGGLQLGPHRMKAARRGPRRHGGQPPRPRRLRRQARAPFLVADQFRHQ